MRDRLNIGLIGFGMMGRTHACAVESQKWYYTPNDPASKARITAVCTRHADTARAAAEGYGLGYPSTDEDELIYSPDIDIIDISTPNIYHFETAKKAILAKKHVLCEKPLTVTADEADELARLASENGVTAQIVFNYRFLAPNRLAKRLTDEGRLGRILSFDIRYLHSSACDTGKPAGWKQTWRHTALATATCVSPAATPPKCGPCARRGWACCPTFRAMRSPSHSSKTRPSRRQNWPPTSATWTK